MANDPTEIIALEKKFWKAMINQDSDAAVSLLADPAVMSAAYGIHHFDHAGYKKMADDPPAKITGFSMSDEKVIFPTPDVAIITYRASQKFTTNGKPVDLTSYDTTTWVRKDNRWLCAVHSETPKGEDQK